MVRLNPAQRDQNNRPVLLGVSSTNSITPIMARVDSITGYLLVDSIADSITATIATKDKRDENDVPTVYGISSTDSTMLIPIRTDSNGRLLIE